MVSIGILSFNICSAHLYLVPTVALVDDPSELSLLPALQVRHPMDVAPPLSKAAPSPVAAYSASPVDAAETEEQPE